MRAPESGSRRRRFLRSPEDGAYLRIRYQAEGWSIRRIARTRGVAYATVWHALRFHEIPLRGRGHRREGSPGRQGSAPGVRRRS